jgi:hypothetical protein
MKHNSIIEDAASKIAASPALTQDPVVGPCLDEYVKLGRIMSAANLVDLTFPVDRTNRFVDQVVKGFPFTSTKHPWPCLPNGLYLQPIAQLDLIGASDKLGISLGAGLLQVWASPDLSDPKIRLISVGDLSDEVDEFYPPNAPWLDSEDYLCLFNCCAFDGAIINWSKPEVQLPCFHLALSPSGPYNLVRDGYVRDHYDEWNKCVLALGFRVSCEHPAMVQLGGYPWSIGNESDSVEYTSAGPQLLLYIKDGQGMFTLQVVFEVKGDGQASFGAILNYM